MARNILEGFVGFDESSLFHAEARLRLLSTSGSGSSFLAVERKQTESDGCNA